MSFLNIECNRFIALLFSIQSKYLSKEEILNKWNRFIEVDATNQDAYSWVRELINDDRRYLALVRPKIKEKGGWGSVWTSPYTQEQKLVQTSTDVLIFSGNSPYYLWRYSAYHQTKALLWVPEFRIATIFGLVGLIKNISLGRIRFGGKVKLYNGLNSLLFTIQKPAKKTSRRYIPSHVPLEELFSQINKNGVRYAILRWYEKLTFIKREDDIDILISDEDIEKFESVVEQYPGLQPIDLYSVSGREGTSYRGMAYFPPKFAQAILEHRTIVNQAFFVPNDEFYFLSLTYHALYQKGYMAGIPTSEKNILFESKYIKMLTVLSQNLKIEVPLTMGDLDAHLHKHGCAPPIDMQQRLAVWNTWVRDKLRTNNSNLSDRGQVGVLIIRIPANIESFLELVRHELKNMNFEIICEENLDVNKQGKIIQYIRGGNWSEQNDISNGKPAHVFLVFDKYPEKRYLQRDLVRYGNLTNDRLLQIKERIRKVYKQNSSDSAYLNIVHGSDNTAQSMEYIKIIFPEYEDRIKTLLNETNHRYFKGWKRSFQVIPLCWVYAERLLKGFDRGVGYFLSEIIYRR